MIHGADHHQELNYTQMAEEESRQLWQQAAEERDALAVEVAILQERIIYLEAALQAVGDHAAKSLEGSFDRYRGALGAIRDRAWGDLHG